MSEIVLANPAAQAMARALVQFLWQGALVGLATAGALGLLAKSRASLRYAVAAGALLVMAALPWITAFRIAQSPAGAAVWAPSAVASVARPGPALASAPRVEPQVQERTFGSSLLPGVFGLWLAGVAVLSAWHLGGLRRVRRLPRQSRPAGEAVEALARDLCRRLKIGRAVTLLESAAVSVPMVIGWLRPVVLVPASTLAGLTPLQLEAILAHELAHVRRHDYLVNLLQAAVETLLFYHPAVWWVSAQVRKERESCCDDLAVAVCGDRLGYARALVDLERMRSTPRLALAATGGSLSDRVRRLVGAPARPSGRPWAAGLLILALLPAGAALQSACAKRSTQETTSRSEARLRGQWWAEKNGDSIRLKMTLRKAGWGSWTSVDDYTPAELTGFLPGPDVPFELRRDAGTFKLRGSFDGKKGGGTMSFAPNPAFAKAMGYRGSDQRLLEMALYDLRLDYVREMKKLGYGSPEQLAQLRRHHILRDTIRDLVRFGHRDRSVESLIQLKNNDITPEYVRAMGQAGYPHLQNWELVELRVNGIEPSFLQGLKDSGYRRLRLEEVMRLHANGVDPNWLRGIVQAGYTRADVDDIISMHLNGIDPKWLLGVVQAGYAHATPQEMISLHANGVDGNFIRQARDRGHGHLSPEELNSLHFRGLDS